MNKTQFKKWVNATVSNNFYVLKDYYSNGKTAIRRDSKHLPDIDPATLLGPKTVLKEHPGGLNQELNRLFSMEYSEPLYATELQYRSGILFFGGDKFAWIDQFFVDCFNLNMVYGQAKETDTSPLCVDGVMIMPIKTELPPDVRVAMKIILDIE